MHIGRETERMREREKACMPQNWFFTWAAHWPEGKACAAVPTMKTAPSHGSLIAARLIVRFHLACASACVAEDV